MGERVREREEGREEIRGGLATARKS